MLQHGTRHMVAAILAFFLFNLGTANANDAVAIIELRRGPGISLKEAMAIEESLEIQFRFSGIKRVIKSADARELAIEAGVRDPDCRMDECLEVISRAIEADWIVMGDVGMLEGKKLLNLVLWKSGRSSVVETYSGEVDFRKPLESVSKPASMFSSAISGEDEPDAIGEPAGNGEVPTGTIAVETRPEGANVWLDAHLAGRTPTVIYEVAVGEHVVTIELMGHQTIQKVIELKAGEVMRVDEILLMRTGGIKIESEPTSAEVIIDGRKAGVTPYTKNGLLVGRHELTVSKPGHSPFTTVFEIEENRVLKRKIVLEKAPVRLLVSTQPSGAMIFVDEKNYGRTVKLLTLTPGKHDVRVYLPGYKEQFGILTLEPGASQVLHFDLEKITVPGPEDMRPLDRKPLDSSDAESPESMSLYREALDEKDLDRRFELLKLAIDISPKFLPAYVLLGETYAGAGRVDDAIATYTEAIEINPDYAPAHKALGKLKYETGDRESATAHLARAAALDPRDDEVRIMLARTYAEKKKYQQALVYLDEAVQINPKNSEAYLMAGKIMFVTGNLEMAVRANLKCLEIDPSRTEAYYILGLAYRGLGDTKSSIYYFEKFIVMEKRPEAADQVENAREQIEDLGGTPPE